MMMIIFPEAAVRTTERNIIFCVQLLKSGEVEVVERGEVGISLTGVRLTLDIIIKDMAGNVFF